MTNEVRGLERGGDGYYHPESVQDVQRLVAEAKRRSVPLRVRGSGHSPKRAIHGDRFTGRGAPPADSLEVVLERMEKVTFVEQHEDHAVVEVEAGCHLGRDPYDPTQTSTWATSLNHQLDQMGYAMAGLGGISHQTVAGFMSTGSSGGSLTHAAGSDIVGVQLVDGRGEVHEVGEGDELFDAVGVSIGLCGVITKVRLKVGRRYDVIGRENTVALRDSPVDLFGANDGRPSLVDYMKETPYSRLLWWPQNDVDRVQFWEARRRREDETFQRQPFTILTPTDSALGSLLMTMIGHVDDLSRLPAVLREIGWYDRFREAFDKPVEEDINAYAGPPQGAANHDRVLRDVQACLTRAISAPGVATNAPGPLPALVAKILARALRALIEGSLPGWLGRQLSAVLQRVLPRFIDEVVEQFIVIEDKHFQDNWMVALPMDNQMDDKLWGTSFTELWMPIDHAQEVMRRLRDYFGSGSLADRYRKTGPFSLEVYPGPSSRFWMSAGYDRVSVRLNPFWFDSWPGRPEERFAPYWDMVKDLDWRPHWGKYLPPASDAWRAHYRRVHPRLDDFLAKRAELDPDQLFVSRYWREHLGIPK
jgi:D-arabinono-1,4-lactone oxidase/FAD binding domain